jgi:uncharacterized protein (DUF1810 family)
MWFIFPEVRGLGYSDLAKTFAISGQKEAIDYLNHVVLGPRLEDCTRLVLNAAPRRIEEIFGSPDDLKFRSSMTLFDFVAPGSVFNAALATFFGGRDDPITLAALKE